MGGGGGGGGGGKLGRLNCDQAVFHFIGIFEKTALRRPGSPRAVAIISSTVAGAHEQSRLRKPAHWAAKMRAVYGENLKQFAFDAPHPPSRAHSLPVPPP